MGKFTLYAFAISFAVIGILPACGIDLRDYRTVDTPAAPGDIADAGEAQTLTINQAWQHLEDSDASYLKWRERYAEEIAKREAPIAFIEGVFTVGLTTLIGEAGELAGPFAPLVTLLGGMALKRRKDSTPDQVEVERKRLQLKHADELRRAKQDSYNAGIEVGKTIIESVKGQESNT